MKIGIWHNTGGGGGARRHLYHHVKGLRARGHELVSVCPDTAEPGELDIGSLIPEHRLPLGPDFKQGRFQHGLRNRDDDLQNALSRHGEEAGRIFKREKIDLLFATNCQLACIPAIARYVDVPSVIYIHDPQRAYDAFFQGWSYPEDLVNAPRYSRWTLLGKWHDYWQIDNRRKYLMHNIRNVSAFTLRLTNSYFCREQLLRSYGAPVHVCYQGVDTSTFKSSGVTREPFLLGVGSFWVHKNIEFILRSIRLCKTPWTLCWVGNSGNPDKISEYAAYASRLGVPFKPVYNISDSGIVDYYNRASVHVCAPLLEPFGLTPLEAGACGLPVIATREGGLRETVIDGRNGLLVDFDEPEFAAAIDRLMGDEALRNEMGAHGLRQVHDRWTLAHSVKRLEDWFQRVMKMDKPGSMHGS